MIVCFLKDGNYFDRSEERATLPAGNSVATKPPSIPVGKYARWWGYWAITDVAPVHIEVIPEPTYRTVITRREFFGATNGLTGDELRAIRKYGENEALPYSGEVYGFINQAEQSVIGGIPAIDLEHQDTGLGFELLDALNLLASGRSASIMQGITA